jgi:hypothetical protein
LDRAVDLWYSEDRRGGRGVKKQTWAFVYFRMGNMGFGRSGDFVHKGQVAFDF